MRGRVPLEASAKPLAHEGHQPLHVGHLPLVLRFTNPCMDYLDSQVAGNNGPLYPKVDHYWFKVAHKLPIMWVVVEVMVPFWVLSITLHRFGSLV